MGPLSSLYAQLLYQQPQDEDDMNPVGGMPPDGGARARALRARLSAGDDGGPIDLSFDADRLPDHPAFNHTRSGMQDTQAYAAARKQQGIPTPQEGGPVSDLMNDRPPVGGVRPDSAMLLRRLGYY